MANKGFSVNFTLEDHSAEVLAAFRQQLDVGLEACGLFGESKAIQIAEEKHIRDTGNLIEHIGHHHEMFSDETIIGVGVDYAIYQEMGTSRQPARPFLKPAVADNASKYKKIIEDALKAQ